MTRARSHLTRRAFLRGALAAAGLGAGCAPRRPVSAATVGGGLLPDIPPVAAELEAAVARPSAACAGSQSPIRSFYLGGFECSTHRYPDGRRLDLTASTRHDVFAREDYARLQSVGIQSAALVRALH